MMVNKKFELRRIFHDFMQWIRIGVEMRAITRQSEMVEPGMRNPLSLFNSGYLNGCFLLIESLKSIISVRMRLYGTIFSANSMDGISGYSVFMPSQTWSSYNYKSLSFGGLI
jgi:hypothetical protein